MADSDNEIDLAGDVDSPEIDREFLDKDDTSNLSALRENISRKGKNSYYYAHGKKIDGPEWDGKEEPRKIESSSAPTVTPSIALSNITEYSWADESKSVKVYIDQPLADTIDDENIKLTSTDSSFDFRYSHNGKDYSLSLPSLFSSIESASVKKKSEKFIISLKKLDEVKWVSLRKTT